MDIKCYLAMTAAEFASTDILPKHPAWMACHFSGYGTGLSNLPSSLPPDAMVIVNDSTPIHNHDPQYIVKQLTQLAQTQKVAGFVLDFQRPNNEETASLARILYDALPCPTGISELYAAGVADAPVFLSTPPPHCSLDQHIAPWKGRQIWLEIATDAEIATVTKNGCSFAPSDTADLTSPIFHDEKLHCRYHIDIEESQAVFTLTRQKEDALLMLEEAKALGIVLAVGLYQQLGKNFPNI